MKHCFNTTWLVHIGHTCSLSKDSCCLDQVFLSGQEVLPLFITYYSLNPPTEQHVSVLAAPLEAALQETLFHPGLAHPTVEGGAAGLGSYASQAAVPNGSTTFLQDEVEQWMEAGGLQKLHAASHKVRACTGPSPDHASAAAAPVLAKCSAAVSSEGPNSSARHVHSVSDMHCHQRMTHNVHNGKFWPMSPFLSTICSKRQHAHYRCTSCFRAIIVSVAGKHATQKFGTSLSRQFSML